MLPHDQLDVLTVAAWDLRASVEAQMRSLTALQRCIADYRRDGDPDLLSEIASHLSDLQEREGAVRQALQLALENLAG